MYGQVASIAHAPDGHVVLREIQRLVSWFVRVSGWQAATTSRGCGARAAGFREWGQVRCVELGAKRLTSRLIWFDVGAGGRLWLLLPAG